MKKYISILGFLGIAILFFIAGRTTDFPIGPIGGANLSASFSNQANEPIRACINKKCTEIKSQCANDDNCATHMECNNSKKCVSVSGPGANKCANDKECFDPQKWCEANNVIPGATITARIYPNGNFTCDCSYKVGNIISQTPCKNPHLQ